MLENKVYNFSELVSVLNEEMNKNEFKPKFGKGVKSAKAQGDDNEKAVKDIIDDAKKSQGERKQTDRKTNPENIEDRNKTTLDYDFAYEPSKEYKDRVKSQVHGFTSVENEKNNVTSDIEPNADFKGNEKFYDTQSKKRKEDAEKKADDKHAGLKSHNLPKEIFKDKTLYTENKMKRLHFKHTQFLNEEQMMAKIPEDYKKDGNKFYMKDSIGNEYLVECKNDEVVGDKYVHVNVLGHNCGKAVLDEALEKFNHLCGYKSESFNSPTNKLDESKEFNHNMDIVRALKEEEDKVRKSKK